jgi:tetratricopeptide (TPR) repeat protein
LGNIYFDAGYYDKSMEIYETMYECCTTDLEKSIALNNISTYYCLIDEKDSTLMFQREALNYAIASGDSLQIAMSKHNLSLKFDNFNELDSALLRKNGPQRAASKGESWKLL